MLRVGRRQPWETRGNGYTTVDLQDPQSFDVDVRRNDGRTEGVLSVHPELTEPLYLALGHRIDGKGHVLSLEQAGHRGHFVLKRLGAKRSEASVIIPRYMEDEQGQLVGRDAAATPELKLPDYVSKMHLRIVTSLRQLDIIDLNSTNGTLVHTPNQPYTPARVIPGGSQVHTRR